MGDDTAAGRPPSTQATFDHRQHGLRLKAEVERVLRPQDVAVDAAQDCGDRARPEQDHATSGCQTRGLAELASQQHGGADDRHDGNHDERADEDTPADFFEGLEEWKVGVRGDPGIHRGQIQHCELQSLVAHMRGRFVHLLHGCVERKLHDRSQNRSTEKILPTECRALTHHAQFSDGSCL